MNKAEVISAFVTSFQELASTMLGCNEIERGELELTKAAGPDAQDGELTGIISFSGSDRGTLAVVFPEKTALKIVGAFMGMEMTEVDDDVTDALGEIVNIISGAAKTKLPTADGEPLQLGLPTVIVGKGYTIKSQRMMQWIKVPISCELGDLCLRITFESFS